MKIICADLPLRNRRDRLLELFLRKRDDPLLEWTLVRAAYNRKRLHRMVKTVRWIALRAGRQTTFDVQSNSIEYEVAQGVARKLSGDRLLFRRKTSSSLSQRFLSRPSAQKSYTAELMSVG